MTVTTLIVLAVLALAAGLFVFRAIPGVRAYFDSGASAWLPARRLTNLKPLRWP